jgi:RNA polymerase sigma factor (sigma-70 family)
MDKLTTLILKYKENKSQIILKEIFEILNLIIKKKATYVYFAKWYPLNLYHPCKYCRVCDKLNNVPKSEHSLFCKDCEKCKCIKGFFNLNKNNLCSYKDVEQDLNLTIMQMLEKFTPEKEFSHYLYTTLWDWRPSFLTKDFVKSFSNQSLTQINDSGDEVQIDVKDEKEEPKISIEDIFKVAESKREKEIIQLFLNDKSMTQEKAGEILGITQQTISLIFNKLQKKLKKYL